MTKEEGRRSSFGRVGAPPVDRLGDSVEERGDRREKRHAYDVREAVERYPETTRPQQFHPMAEAHSIPNEWHEASKGLDLEGVVKTRSWHAYAGDLLRSHGPGPAPAV